jgi:hypothetical protein
VGAKVTICLADINYHATAAQAAVAEGQPVPPAESGKFNIDVSRHQRARAVAASMRPKELLGQTMDAARIAKTALPVVGQFNNYRHRWLSQILLVIVQ